MLVYCIGLGIILFPCLIFLFQSNIKAWRSWTALFFIFGKKKSLWPSSCIRLKRPVPTLNILDKFWVKYTTKFWLFQLSKSFEARKRQPLAREACFWAEPTSSIERTIGRAVCHIIFVGLGFFVGLSGVTPNIKWTEPQIIGPAQLHYHQSQPRGLSLG